MIAAAAVLHQRSPAEDPDDRLVQKERQSGVQSALEQIEWQDAGDQDADDRLSGHAEIDRRDDIIPQQHAEDAAYDTSAQSDECALARMVTLIDPRGHAGKRAGRDHVHEHIEQIAAAIHDLQQRSDDAHDERGAGTVDKAADDDDDILRVIAQKLHRWDQRKVNEQVDDDCQGAKHAQRRDFLCSHVHKTAPPDQQRKTCLK